MFQHLDLVENEYFGLKFCENVQNPFMANTDDMVFFNCNFLIVFNVNNIFNLFL